MKMCARCNENPASVYVTKIENGESKQEWLCVPCAEKIGLLKSEDVMRQLGISPDDIDDIKHFFSK